MLAGAVEGVEVGAECFAGVKGRVFWGLHAVVWVVEQPRDVEKQFIRKCKEGHCTGSFWGC